MGSLSSAASGKPRAEYGVLTLFPELFGEFSRTSLFGRALKEGHAQLHLEQLREHGLGKHKSVDDTPYGGGAGMVLRVDCVVAGIEALQARFSGGPIRRVLLSPQGQTFTQKTARRWSEAAGLMFICGRYEGFDERVRDYVDEEASLGDFVLTGGEVAAMAMMEACVRLIPGVLGNEQSAESESFSDSSGGGLEYPQYTRPLTFRDAPVPEVLRSGNHAEIERWRQEQSQERTRQRRPDLVPNGGKPTT
jgi:tRNA (guanine37-N1)-methyltransferase